MNLEAKVAFVTGGSRGIGRAIAIKLAEAGACVAFSYNIQKEDAENTVQIIKNSGGQAMAMPLNVCDRGSIKAAFSSCEKTYGGIDILINNAGVNKPTDFDQVTEKDWDEILDVNLKGPFICCQEVLAFMRKRGGGSIVNIGSVSGQYGGPRTAHYAASKAGLISLGQVVARHAAKDNIRCNTLAAGLVESDMAASGMKSAAVAKASENILLGRFGTKDEVGDAAVFLASDSSSYLTAQTINVNGGLYF